MDDEQHKAFLDQFNRIDSQLTTEEQAIVGLLLVKNQRIFARHGLDIGINNKVRIKLTPKHDEPVYAPSLPTPTSIKDEMLFNLGSEQKYGLITALSFSRDSSPIYAQRKPNRKLRVLVGPKRINQLIKHDYIERNQPFTTIADAAQEMAGEKVLW